MPLGIDRGVSRVGRKAWQRPQNALMQLRSCSSAFGIGLKSLVDIEMDGIWG